MVESPQARHVSRPVGERLPRISAADERTHTRFWDGPWAALASVPYGANEAAEGEDDEDDDAGAGDVSGRPAGEKLAK